MTPLQQLAKFVSFLTELTSAAKINVKPETVKKKLSFQMDAVSGILAGVLKINWFLEEPCQTVGFDTDPQCGELFLYRHSKSY